MIGQSFIRSLLSPFQASLVPESNMSPSNSTPGARNISLIDFTAPQHFHPQIQLTYSQDDLRGDALSICLARRPQGSKYKHDWSLATKDMATNEMIHFFLGEIRGTYSERPAKFCNTQIRPMTASKEIFVAIQLAKVKDLAAFIDALLRIKTIVVDILDGEELSEDVQKDWLADALLRLGFASENKHNKYLETDEETTYTLEGLMDMAKNFLALVATLDMPFDEPEGRVVPTCIMKSYPAALEIMGICEKHREGCGIY